MTREEERIVEEYKRIYTYDEEYDSYGVLGMKYDQKVIDFFKRQNLYEEEMFDNLQKNTWGVCHVDKDKLKRVGCPYITKDGKLLGYVIIIPDETNDYTMFSQVHEIAHGIYAYKHLEKKIDLDAREVLPFIVEKLYVEELNNEKINKYSEHLDRMIDETAHLCYRFALDARNQLMDSFDGNIDTLDRQSKRLLRKYKKHNK